MFRLLYVCTRHSPFDILRLFSLVYIVRSHPTTITPSNPLVSNIPFKDMEDYLKRH